MCGINGIFLRDRSKRVEQDSLLRMRDCMVHRGPDEAGVYIDDDLGLGHRRLSIIGLTTGQQPMSDNSGRYTIIYNGETYNYAALRRDLQKRGYEFRTESDTEVVLSLYIEYGKDCVEFMNGLFAFAIWDKQARKLFVARDRLGIKPLYYVDGPNGFLFASEIKSILASGRHTGEVDVNAVYEYFVFRAVSGEQTLFQGIRSLLPGHRMEVTEGSCKTEPWWNGLQGDATGTETPEAAIDRLDELLNDAVRIRLMSEVPLGTFCSGGVDSSLVTAIAANARGSAINTFSVGFDDEKYDESEYARTVSDAYGTTHHEIRVSGRQFADSLPELIRLNDEPLNFANSVHIFAVSKLAKEHVTVVLTGEGADELFLGYPRYHLPRLAARLSGARWLASPGLAVAARVLKDHRFEKLRRYLKVSASDRVMLNAAALVPELASSMLNSAVARELPYRESVARELASSGLDVMGQLSLNDQHTYLVSILNRQDKMSMGTSVEARVPFLDYRIVEFANQLRSAFKTRGSETKQIVKKLAERYLPENVVHRRKSGFGVPLPEYFRDAEGLGALARRLFNDCHPDGIVNKAVLLRKLEEHSTGTADHSEALWTACNFLLWQEQYDLPSK